jgi:hypothetical protein
MHGSESAWTEVAAWVEVLGAIAAVIGSGWVAASESRATRRREDRAAAAAIVKEERAVLATKTAALTSPSWPRPRFAICMWPWWTKPGAGA